eukprot:2607698-Amphidinium_carterae.1
MQSATHAPVLSLKLHSVFTATLGLSQVRCIDSYFSSKVTREINVGHVGNNAHISCDDAFGSHLCIMATAIMYYCWMQRCNLHPWSNSSCEQNWNNRSVHQLRVPICHIVCANLRHK